MRELEHRELAAVSGGETYGVLSPLVTLSLMALTPTPLVLAVGTAALLYYAWC